MPIKIPMGMVGLVIEAFINQEANVLLSIFLKMGS